MWRRCFAIYRVLTPMGRQAFLLDSNGRVPAAGRRACLEMTQEDVSLLLEDANQDISAQLATDVVIIEDEPLIAIDLEHLVQRLGHRVVRVAWTERQAIEAVKEARPAVVLADIQLADGSSGSRRRERIPADRVRSGHLRHSSSRKAATGTKPEPTFLVRKPFNPEALKAVISQALFFYVRGRSASS